MPDPPEPPEPAQGPDQPDPGYGRVRDFLLYSLSVPERTLRTASGVVAGALRESASLLVPQAFRSSRTYSVMIQQMLDFLAEDVGGVERAADQEAAPKVENFVARRAVGNFVDMAGLATFHLSPMLILALVSDLAYGSQAYLKELAEDLKEQGVIDPDSTIDHADDLMEALAGAAGATAQAFSTPPLSVSGLRQTMDEVRTAAESVDPTTLVPEAEVRRLWDDIHQIATTQGVDPLAVSSAMTLYSLDKIANLGRGALSTVTVAGSLCDRHVLSHYRGALDAIREKGIYRCLAETSKPYITAVWKNYSTRSTTITEEVLSGRLVGKTWTAVRRWLGGSTAVGQDEQDGQDGQG